MLSEVERLRLQYNQLDVQYRALLKVLADGVSMQRTVYVGEITPEALTLMQQGVGGELLPGETTPIDMVLHCPKCGTQHIDAPDDSRGPIKCQRRPECAEPCGEWCGWTNPPHRSHLCGNATCGHIWRPADVPTNGVAAIKTRGKDDSPVVSYIFRGDKQGDTP